MGLGECLDVGGRIIQHLRRQSVLLQEFFQVGTEKMAELPSGKGIDNPVVALAEDKSKDEFSKIPGIFTVLGKSDLLSILGRDAGGPYFVNERAHLKAAITEEFNELRMGFMGKYDCLDEAVTVDAPKHLVEVLVLKLLEYHLSLLLPDTEMPCSKGFLLLG